jgi:hypothetical protein
MHPSIHPAALSALMAAAAYGWIVPSTGAPPAPPAPRGLGALASTPAQRIYLLASTTIMAVMATALVFLALGRSEVATARAGTPDAKANAANVAPPPVPVTPVTPATVTPNAPPATVTPNASAPAPVVASAAPAASAAPTTSATTAATAAPRTNGRGRSAPTAR